jgi:GxxExxY protein
MIQDLQYNEITQRIIGCAMNVHSKMKNGYVESVYQKCLAIELKKNHLHFQQEVDVPINYDGIVVGRRRVDFIVEENIIVEIKAVTTLENSHLAQAINYLETHHLHIGLLINFGAKSLQFKRLVNGQTNQVIKNPINPINP